jgi:peptide/nickel transport system substrate-binding protein
MWTYAFFPLIFPDKMSFSAAFRLWIGLFLTACLISGCSRQNDTTQATAPGRPMVSDLKPIQGDWVVQRIDSDVDTLNPAVTQTTNGQVVTSLICESMLHTNNYTLKLDPMLAESYEISPDQLTYTFHLRHDVKWHDGEPFTAEDVKFTFDKIMDPKDDTAPIRSYFTTVKSCEVLDPYTIRFLTSERYFKTLEVLGTLLQIVPKHAFAHGDPSFDKNGYGRHPIGTGPYKFVRWDTNARIVLERNDNYWDASMMRYPKRLDFEVIEEPYVAAQLLKKGDIDAIDHVSPIQWVRELKDSRSMKHLREIVYPYPAYNYLGFNLRDPLFQDIRVRHAIDLLIPRQKVLDQVYLKDYGTETAGYDPPGDINYNHGVPPTPLDPAQAQQLLTDAGWKNDHGDGFLYKDGKPFSFTLLYPTGNPSSEKIGELIQESMRGAGIDVHLDRQEFAQLIDRVNEWKFQATLQGWSTDVNGDPSQLWASADADVKKSSNFIGYKSAVADKLMAEARLEYDPDKRAAIYHQLQKVIHDDYPVCFLFNPRLILVVSDRYQNVKTFTPRPCFDITTWWVPRAMQKYGN